VRLEVAPGKCWIDDDLASGARLSVTALTGVVTRRKTYSMYDLASDAGRFVLSVTASRGVVYVQVYKDWRNVGCFMLL
jgi:hypothetical protein